MSAKDEFLAIPSRYLTSNDMLEWLDAFPDLQTAWQSAKRGDAMLLLLSLSSHPDNDDLCRKMTLAAVRCVKLISHLITDERSRNAIDVAERFANGEATIEELSNAANTARVAYLNHVGVIAWRVTDAVEHACKIDLAWATPEYVAEALRVEQIVCSDYSDEVIAAADALLVETLEKCANIVRDVFPVFEIYN